tara:strand:- start:3349 stop:7164 length:3816 start_codon:yes stop_codon:yes gene_type:complete
MTALRVNESSGSAGSIQVADGFGGFLSGSLTAGPNITISNDGSGSFAITASLDAGTAIGEAEDGTYEDGLFTDFVIDTPIGTAVDRFNEVLKALAPSPAPGLDDINSLQSGTNLFLSFGSSNDQSSASPAYVSVAGTAGVAAAVDVNGAYNITTSSNNIRLGAFDGDTHISGVLNADVTANSQGNNVQNFPAFSFGDSEVGVLRLNVNGTTIKEIDLTVAQIGSGTSGLGTGSHLDASGSGFNLFSQPTTGTFSNGNAFNSFQHRTGQFVIASGSQRRGWNYARVQHVKSGSTSTTNYLEWVNDDNNDSLAAAGNSIAFEGSGSVHLSGVKYFRSGSGTYKARVTNAYKLVYDNNNITFTTNNNALESSSPSFSISAQSKPTIGAGEDHTKVLHITGSGTISANYFLSGALTGSINVTHPFKSNLSSAGSSVTSGILMYNLTNNSTSLVENFRRENFRIISGAYDTQASLVDNSNVWDSTRHMTASNGAHTNGLQFYNTRLYSPTNTLRSGDFRSTSDGGKLDNAPSNNPNYSGQSGLRTFYRWFKNETGSDKQDFSIAINGVGSTIVSAATALNSGRIRVFVKFPSDGTRSTGWLDLASEFVLDSYADNDGAHTANGSLSFDSTLNATNIVTLGTVSVGNNEYIGVRVESDAGWTGYIDSITVSFGAGTGTITPIPDLDDIDCDDDGIDSNLSFGVSKSITGYSNVGSSAGLGSAVDINGLYKTDSNSNNLRRSVFAFDRIVEGRLNEDVSANSPDFVANAFSDANSGSLVLEVNGVDLHSVELTGSFNLVGSGEPGIDDGTGGTSFTNSSGFFDLSVWRPAEFDNEVPHFLEIQRTGKYRVHTNAQRKGWNYARVKHVGTWGIRTTNYVEWVNDDDNNGLSIANLTLKPFKSDTLFHQSGVKYFIQPSGSLEVQINNLYRNVYSDSNSAISFNNLNNASGVKIIQSGSGLTSTKTTTSSTATLQNLATTTNSEQQPSHVSGSLRFSLTGSLSGSYANYTKHSTTGSLVFDHPLKSNLDTHNTLVMTSSVLLVYSSSDTSNTNTLENFTGELFRIQSGSYTTQNSVTDVLNNWSSTGSLNDNIGFPGYYTGLMQFDTRLISPLDGGNTGDFRNYSEGGIFEGPDSNVNYSSLGIATREYYRAFLNPTTNDLARITVSLAGDASLVGKTGANQATLGANKNIFVEVRIPGKTAFLDLGKPSAGAGNISAGDGCLFGDLNGTISKAGTSNVITFNGQTVDGTSSGAEYFVIKISAHKDWTGFLNSINVTWSG